MLESIDGARADASLRLPNAFFLTEIETPEGKETILLSQAQHRAIANAIIDGEGARAEALAREHSRLARTNLETR